MLAISVSEEARCDACGILIGDGHENHYLLPTQTDVGLKQLCRDCWRVWQERIVPLGMPWGVWVDSIGDARQRWLA